MKSRVYMPYGILYDYHGQDCGCQRLSGYLLVPIPPFGLIKTLDFDPTPLLKIAVKTLAVGKKCITCLLAFCQVSHKYNPVIFNIARMNNRRPETD